MRIRSTMLAVAAISAITAAAHAKDLQPIEAQSIDLGEVSGVAYYTVEQDGFRVVATLTQGSAGTPLRLEAVLAPDQSVVFSTAEGDFAPEAVEISREDDRVEVRKAVVSTTTIETSQKDAQLVTAGAVAN